MELISNAAPSSTAAIRHPTAAGRSLRPPPRRPPAGRPQHARAVPPDRHGVHHRRQAVGKAAKSRSKAAVNERPHRRPGRAAGRSPDATRPRHRNPVSVLRWPLPAGRHVRQRRLPQRNPPPTRRDVRRHIPPSRTALSHRPLGRPDGGRLRPIDSTSPAGKSSSSTSSTSQDQYGNPADASVILRSTTPTPATSHLHQRPGPRAEHPHRRLPPPGNRAHPPRHGLPARRRQSTARRPAHVADLELQRTSSPARAWSSTAAPSTARASASTSPPRRAAQAHRPRAIAKARPRDPEVPATPPPSPLLALLPNGAFFDPRVLRPRPSQCNQTRFGATSGPQSSPAPAHYFPDLTAIATTPPTAPAAAAPTSPTTPPTSRTWPWPHPRLDQTRRPPSPRHRTLPALPENRDDPIAATLGAMVLPSFHRPELINYWAHTARRRRQPTPPLAPRHKPHPPPQDHAPAQLARSPNFHRQQPRVRPHRRRPPDARQRPAATASPAWSTAPGTSTTTTTASATASGSTSAPPSCPAPTANSSSRSPPSSASTSTAAQRQRPRHARPRRRRPRHPAPYLNSPTNHRSQRAPPWQRLRPRRISLKPVLDRPLDTSDASTRPAVPASYRIERPGPRTPRGPLRARRAARRTRRPGRVRPGRLNWDPLYQIAPLSAGPAAPTTSPASSCRPTSGPATASA